MMIEINPPVTGNTINVKRVSLTEMMNNTVMINDESDWFLDGFESIDDSIFYLTNIIGKT